MTCEECHAVAGDRARGWRAYLMDDRTPCADAVLFYCPACALAEFGPLRPQRSLLADDE